jgi:hypothetical protein
VSRPSSACRGQRKVSLRKVVASSSISLFPFASCSHQLSALSRLSTTLSSYDSTCTTLSNLSRLPASSRNACMMDEARRLLKDVWGYESFRGVQEQVRQLSLHPI